jgi:hypothetical protein
MSTSSASRRTHDDYALVCSELGRAEQRPFDPLSLAAFLPVRARILLRLLDSPFQSATERNSTLFGHGAGAELPPSAGRWQRRDNFCGARR